jgi:hypothetical protein
MHGASMAGLRQIGHHDLAGNGDGMQVMRGGDALYVAHFGPSRMGTSILDASDPTNLRLVAQWPVPGGGHTHKVQVADGLLLTNHEHFRGSDPDRAGLCVYDLTDPFAPEQVGFWESGGRGVHRIVYEGGRYAYLSATPDDYRERIWFVIDVSDPSNPIEAGRWWWPGMRLDETPTWPEGENRSVHHAMVQGDRAYLGFWDSGMVILDTSDLSDIRTISHLNWTPGGHTHTVLPLPGRDYVVVTDEQIKDGRAVPHLIRVVDISDEANPEVVAICPEPGDEYWDHGLRYGAHCLHENRPGSYRSAEVVLATYFNAGVRVYDVADPTDPKEIAHWVGECPPGQEAIQMNDLWVDEDLLIYGTDRAGSGVYVLEPEPELRARMEAARL